jgi:elongation factor P
MISASQLRGGMAIEYQGQRYKVIAADYHPGQGKMGGVAHTRLQNIDTGTFWEHSFRAELKLESIPLEKQALEFSYSDGDQYCFMDPLTFDQIEIHQSLIGPQAALLTPGLKVSVEFVDRRAISVTFPDTMEVRVTDTAPPVHQQQDNTLKPATVENGLQVMVPQFVKTGDSIRIDVATLKYMDRARAEAKGRAV